MLFNKFLQFIETKELITPGAAVLLAVSGGIDSVVMSHLFSQSGLTFGIAHCNFGLRGEESDLDEKFVENLAGRLGVKFHVKRFRTKSFSRAQGISIQMAARDLRYDWFENIRKKHGYQHIATAHHLDDQAETFLINLLRGTGIAGLHGIPVINGKVIRPMMFALRTGIEAYAGQHSITFREDLSNSTTRYLRNKIRHDILPLFKTIQPDFAESLARTVDKVSAYESIASETLNIRKAEVLKVGEDLIQVDISSLMTFTQPHTLAWFILSPFGFNEMQVARLMNSLGSPAGKTFISPTHILVKERRHLIIRPAGKKSQKPEEIYIVNEFTADASLPVSLHFKRIDNNPSYSITNDRDTACLDADKVQFPLTLRKWEPGDAFRPLGMKGKKKLSDFFMDLKLSARQKEEVWLLCSGGEIVWVTGFRINHRFRVTASTKNVLECRI